MKSFFIFSLLLLAGCTSSHYAPAYGNNASQEQLDSDQSECVHKVMKKASELNAGVLVGGVILGPLGAIAGNAISNSGNTKPDYNVEIEKCMAAKGYTGVSKGYN